MQKLIQLHFGFHLCCNRHNVDLLQLVSSQISDGNTDFCVFFDFEYRCALTALKTELSCRFMI